MPALKSRQYEITNSQSADLDFIFFLFDEAIAYQQRNGYELWPRFSREMIEHEIAEKRHWRIVYQDKIICIFSVLYNDPLIWGEADEEPSVYLHRIAINPEFKGRGVIRLVRDWAVSHAKLSGRQYVRMDTWGHNIRIRNYYIQNGFRYIGQRILPEIDGQPVHYGGRELSLFEVEVG